MFQRCEKLEDAPMLPATEMKYSSYSHMFNGCKSLKKAPVLPALNLNYWCYEKRFNGCSSLNYIKMIATKVMKDTWSGYKLVDITADNIGTYCTEWVNGVAASGTFVKNPDAAWEVRGINAIPEGWTIQ